MALALLLGGVAVARARAGLCRDNMGEDAERLRTCA